MSAAWFNENQDFFDVTPRFLLHVTFRPHVREAIRGEPVCGPARLLGE